MREIRGAGTGTLYARIINPAGLWWNGATFEAYNAANWATYAIAMTQDGASGLYFATMPALITTAGSYDYFVYQQGGASPAESDLLVTTGKVEWTGSAVVVPSNSATLDTAVALISLEDAKAYVGATGTESDAILCTFINSMSQWVLDFLGRSLLSKTYTEYYHGNGTDTLILRNRPITAITSIHIDSLRGWAADTAVTVADDVIQSKEAGIIRLWNNQCSFPRGMANVKVVYTAGYTLTTMPHGIRQAVRRILDRQDKGRTHHSLDIASQSVGDTTTTFNSAAIPADALSMIQRYANFLSTPDFSHAD